MIKKALVLSLVTAFVLSAAACGKQTASNKDTNLDSVTAVVSEQTDRRDLIKDYATSLLPGEMSIVSNVIAAASEQAEKNPIQQDKQVIEPDDAAKTEEADRTGVEEQAVEKELLDYKEEERENVPQPVTNTNKNRSVTNTGYNYRFKNSAQEAECREIAGNIAQMIESETDDPWMQIAYLARYMNMTYVARLTYCYEGNYDNPYGVFVEHVGTCAGVTRATGMVLDALGIKWSHANPNQYKHQWNIIEIDGEIGYCDSSMYGRSGKGTLIV